MNHPLNNKTVFTEDPDTLMFLLPGRRVAPKRPLALMKTTDVVYQLHSKDAKHLPRTKRTLERCYRHWTILTDAKNAAADLRVETPGDLTRLAGECRGIKVSKTILGKVEKLDERELKIFIKTSVALGRWWQDGLTRREKTYRLFEAMAESKIAFLRLYEKLAETSTPNELFASILTFLLRVSTYDEQKEHLSAYYRTVVKRTRATAGTRIKPGLMALADMPDTVPEELRFLCFYMNLR